MEATKTTVDWFRVRARAEVRDTLDALRPMFGGLGDHLSLDFLPRGILGFEQGARLDLGGAIVGRMDWGGESQRGWVRVDIGGQGCGWVQDWQAAQGVESLGAAEIRRLDIALTTWDGSVHHDRVRAAHEAGGFNCGGRPPNMRIIDNSEKHRGRTCEIGRREKSDKFLRGYEKGHEMCKDFATVPERIDGHRVEDIYRVEVEFKAETRPIPWECIERRDQYFAGAYPFLGQLLPEVECDILMRRPERVPQLELKSRLDHIRLQWGTTLYTALKCYQGDIGELMSKIVGDKDHAGMVAAGVLLVDH